MASSSKTITPKLIIHGGCGIRSLEKQQALSNGLLQVIRASYPRLIEQTAEQAVLHACRLLEDDETFNAGTGGRLQADGMGRLSAAFMDGAKSKFAAVMNVENVRNPIDLAHQLSSEEHTVLAGELATAYARSKGVPHYNPVTPRRLRQHEEQLKGKTGTIGVVALDAAGNICAGTSTGGVGQEIPGRVGDSPTVAGNYASSKCGISCTGVGEEILNLAVAARVATAVEYQVSLSQALKDVTREGDSRNYEFGTIAIDQAGELNWNHTQNTQLHFAYHDGQAEKSFLCLGL